MAASDRYIEWDATLPQNGYTHKDYYVTFATSGNKLFQTFGAVNTEMYLYDAEYNQLAYNNNSGASYNAMFNYTVEANKQYILRIKLLDNLSTSDIKVGITPASISYAMYESILDIESTGVAYQFVFPPNTTCVMTFTPTTSGTYTFTTNYSGDTRIDTYLYLIDPYTTNPCLYNDDGAGNLQALITAALVRNDTYFIVLSPYNITATSGTLKITVDKVS